jgi:hypothetical protein
MHNQRYKMVISLEMRRGSTFKIEVEARQKLCGKEETGQQLRCRGKARHEHVEAEARPKQQKFYLDAASKRGILSRGTITAVGKHNNRGAMHLAVYFACLLYVKRASDSNSCHRAFNFNVHTKSCVNCRPLNSRGDL